MTSYLLQDRRYWNAMAPCVDEKYGIIKSINLVKTRADEPWNAFTAFAEPASIVPLAGRAGANNGAACSTSPFRAAVRACGEALERYCSTFFDLADLELASPRSLRDSGREFVLPGEIYPFTDAQYGTDGFPYSKVVETSQLRWIAGRGVRSGRVILVPASCVFVPYHFVTEIEPVTHMPISTGLAAGPSIEYCIAKGFLECVERDAFMIRWNCKLVPWRICPSELAGRSEELDQILAVDRPREWDWHFAWITVDVHVPVVLAILSNRHGLPMTSVGVAADSEPLEAIRKAAEEALLSRVLLNRSSEIASNNLASSMNCRTLRDHLLSHAVSGRLRRELDFLTVDAPRVPYEAFEQGYLDIDLMDTIHHFEPEPVAVDVTTADVDAVGVKVVRTIVRGLQPLDNDHAFRYFGGDRLGGWLARGGSGGRLRAINPAPHPFP